MQFHRSKEKRALPLPLEGYLAAALAVGLAVGLRFLLLHLAVWQAPLVLLAMAVGVATVYRGLWPGLFAAALAAAAWTFLFTNSIELNFFMLFLAGALVSVLSSLLVSARRQAVASEATSVQQEKLIDLSHDAILVRDANSAILKWNAGATATYGWTGAEALGKVTDALFQTRFPVSPGEVAAKLSRDGFWEGELIHTCRSGAEIVVESRQVLLRDAPGMPVRILEINRECTDRKRAEEAMRRSESRFRSLSEANVVGVACGDRAGKIVDANNAFLQMTGYGNDDVRSGAIAWRAIAGESQVPFEKELVRKDGARIPVLVCATVLDAAEKEAVVLMVDLSERKALERQLQQKQKMETIGLLAAGVAHDFNNLLTGILMNAQLALELFPAGHSGRVMLEEVTRFTGRAASLTSQLLAYAGKGRLFVQRTDLSAVVSDMAVRAQSLMPQQIRLRLELASGLPLVEADAAQVQQLAMSLIVNAAEAIGEDQAGEIVLTTGECEQHVMIRVQDTGCGMDEATQAKVFDPFFTTKFIGRGLGLSAAQGIMRAHQGTIRIVSAPGEGSTVEALFPVP